YGLSEQAVINQVLIALITYCMIKILKMKVAFKGELLELYRLLKTCLSDNFSDFLKKLFRPKRPSKGRRRQVMSGDLDQFYDLTYDPLFL
ncbi:MAG: IS4 family transposase, partial [Halanaerobiales bacterium]|nr:IS4 family transposase [Halanaerobiales bacterium]